MATEEEKAERNARKKATTDLFTLGVAVYDGQVYKWGYGVATGKPARPQDHLGALAGARAEVVSGIVGHRRSDGRRPADTLAATALVGPLGLLAGISRQSRVPTKGTAFVIFADGTTHEKQITSAADLLKAQAEAVRFNALAPAAGD